MIVDGHKSRRTQQIKPYASDLLLQTSSLLFQSELLILSLPVSTKSSELQATNYNYL